MIIILKFESGSDLFEFEVIIYKKISFEISKKKL